AVRATGVCELPAGTNWNFDLQWSPRVLCELPAGTNWNFDLQWSPRVPGLLSASCFDGHVSLYNIEVRLSLYNIKSASSKESDFGASLANRTPMATSRAPKWLKRPCGATFGFGGRLLCFGSKVGQAGHGAQVAVHSVVTEEGVVARADEFEAAVAGGDRRISKPSANTRRKLATAPEDRETWDFLTVLFEDAHQIPSSRSPVCHQLFSSPHLHTVVPAHAHPWQQSQLLGLRRHEPSNAASVLRLLLGAVVASGNQRARGVTASFNPLSHALTLVPSPPLHPLPPYLAMRCTYAPSHEWSVLCDELAARLEATGAVAGGNAYAPSHKWSVLCDELAARLEAPLSIRPTLFPFHHSCHHPLPFSQYAPSHEWSVLCDELAARLEAAGQWQAATLCFMCAGSIDRVVDIWASRLQPSQGSPPLPHLQDLIEKAVVLGLATGQSRVGGRWAASLVSEYATVLAAQGRAAAAQHLLSLLPPWEESVNDPSVAEAATAAAALKERIYRSGLVVVDPSQPAPPFPFTSVDVPVGSTTTTTAAAAAAKPYATQQSAFAVAPAQPSYYQACTCLISCPAFVHPPPMQPMQPMAAGQAAPGAQPSFMPVAPPPVAAPPPSTHHMPSGPPPGMMMPTQPPPAARAAQGPRPVAFTPVAPPPAHRMPTGPPPGMAPTAPPPGVFPPGAPPPGVLPPGVPPPGAAPMMRPTGPPPGVRPPGVAAVGPPGAAAAAPAAAAPAPAAPEAAPPAPPPTVQTADTSNVAPELRPVAGTLGRVYKEVAAAVAAQGNAGKKREMDANSKKLGLLLQRLNQRDVSPSVAGKLGPLCAALDAGDYATALHIQVDLTTKDWEECGVWLTALKSVIKTRQQLG
ncbi:unnamed protein product, partial [Closterium sp. NIES-65]